MPHCYYCNALVRPTAQFCATCAQLLLIHGRYRLEQLLGQVGFGVVYAAHDERLNSRCAIKKMASASLAAQRQVEAEANILSQHAGHLEFLPDIYDIWSEQSQTYLVMEYIDGDTLDRLLQPPWSAAPVEAFLRELLTDLVQLHAAGVIHRDLKPENIKRTSQGRYVLLDFGIDKQGATTMTIARAGSLDYVPPEQLRGEPTDAHSDLYSLAATAYHLLTETGPTLLIHASSLKLQSCRQAKRCRMYRPHWSVRCSVCSNSTLPPVHVKRRQHCAC